MLPCPSKPPRWLSERQDHAAEAETLDVGNAVVPCEPLVEERIVGTQQIERAAILANHALDEHLGLDAKRLPQGIVEVGKRLLHRDRRRQVAQEEPLPGEVAHERGEPIVGHHAADLAIEHGRVAQPPLFRQPQQFLVGNAAPQEKREPRGELDITDAIRRIGRNARWIGFDAQQELGADEQTLQRVIDAFIKATACRAGAIERHQRLHIVGGHRAPIGAARQRTQDRTSTRRGIVRRRGSAREDPLPARRRARAGRIEGAGDLHAAQVGPGPRLGDVHASGIGALKRQSRGFGHRRRLLDERHLHSMRTRLDRNADLPLPVGAIALRLPLAPTPAACPAAARSGTTSALRRRAIVGWHVTRCDRLRRRRRGRPGDAGQREDLDALPIQAHFQQLILGVDRHLLVQIPRQLHANGVVGVHGERVSNGGASARAEDLRPLPIVLRRDRRSP